MSVLNMQVRCKDKENLRFSSYIKENIPKETYFYFNLSNKKHGFIFTLYFHPPPNHNLKPPKKLSSTLNPGSQFENHFPTPQNTNFKMKFHFQTQWKPKFKLKYHFHTERKSFLKKISYFRTRRKSERELTNYLVNP